MAEELDLNDVLEYAITLEQRRIESGQGTVYVPKFKVRQNTSTTSTFLSDLVYFSDTSVWSKYSETYREYFKKFDENTFTQTDSDRLSGFGYICNFKKGFREKLQESCQSDNTLELYVEKIKKLEEEIADAYPMLSHVGMNNIKSDRINDIVVYVKTMDRMRNI